MIVDTLLTTEDTPGIRKLYLKRNGGKRVLGIFDTTIAAPNPSSGTLPVEWKEGKLGTRHLKVDGYANGKRCFWYVVDEGKRYPQMREQYVLY